MAEAVQEKGRGLKFAEQQLLRHGWEQGKGLGREENGISEAIKVKVKCDKGGVGHNEAEQFTFHWWDHVFNKAASSLEVESDQNGVQVKKVVEEEEEGMISNKKPRKAALAKARLYGCFVKSATLLSGQELPEQKAYSSDDSSSSSDDDDKLDLSSTTMLSDADLMKACGGRTAHKGARHGLTMSAKLARLEQQEQQFMAKYGKASQSASIVAESAIASNKPAQTPEVEEAVEVHSKEQKKKKKKKRKNNDAEENVSEERADDAVTPKKKKKKRSKEGGEVALESPASAEQPTAGVTEVDHAKKKRRKKTKTTENDSSSSHETTVTLEEKDIAGGGEEASGREQAEKATQQQSHTDLETKRKKKSSKSKQEDPVVEVIEVDAETAVIPIPKKKKKRDRAIDSLSVHGDVKHA